MRLALRHAAPAAAFLSAALMAACLSACTGSDGGPSTPGPDPYPWSLDLDLSGDVSLRGIRGDTSATSEVTDEVSGRVVGYDPEVGEDTLRFLNVEYDQFVVNAPLAADGTFRFDGAELVGDLDGSMTILITHAVKVEGRRSVPDTIFLALDRPCGGRPCE